MNIKRFAWFPTYCVDTAEVTWLTYVYYHESEDWYSKSKLALIRSK